MKKHNKSEHGQALVLIALAIVGMIGMIGLTIDGGLAYSDRRNAQNAADTAALAAGRSFIREEAWQAAALSLASSNGYNNNGTTNTVEIEHPVADYGDDADEYIRVTITSHYQTSFARVVGISQMTNIVDAVVKVVPTTEVNMFDGNAMVSLNPTACKAIHLQGNAAATLTGGGIFVNSDCDPNAFNNDSGAADLTAPSLCTVGTNDLVESSIHIPPGAIQDQCGDQYTYPVPDYVMPLPDCGGPALPYPDPDHGPNMSAGEWSGTFPPAGVTFLDPGVYCVDGDFTLHGGDSLTGSDVIIYMETGEVRWNANSEVHLDPPNEGPFEGLLIYLPYENDSPITYNGSASNDLTGTILAPASQITLNGGEESTINGQIIGYTITLTGGGGTNINFNASENYHAETPPNLQLEE